MWNSIIHWEKKTHLSRHTQISGEGVGDRRGARYLARYRRIRQKLSDTRSRSRSHLTLLISYLISTFYLFIAKPRPRPRPRPAPSLLLRSSTHLGSNAPLINNEEKLQDVTSRDTGETGIIGIREVRVKGCGFVCITLKYETRGSDARRGREIVGRKYCLLFTRYRIFFSEEKSAQKERYLIFLPYTFYSWSQGRERWRIGDMKGLGSVFCAITIAISIDAKSNTILILMRGSLRLKGVGKWGGWMNESWLIPRKEERKFLVCVWGDCVWVRA